MMRRQSLVILLVTLVLAAPAFAQRNRDRDRDEPRETETVERTVTLPSGGTVRLKTFSGQVNITGTGGNQVVIKAVRRAPRERLDEIKLEVTQNGNVVEIDANHRLVERRNENVVETDFDIQVPADATLDLRTFSAPVTVDGVVGSVGVDGFSSAVRLTGVSAPVRVKTFSGRVDIEARNWSDGDHFNVETFSGPVVVRVPASARGDIRFDSFSGRFDSDFPVTMSTSSRRAFRGALNGGGNTDFTLKTFSGDVSIRK